ncbi:MAG: hypothetical protein ACI8PZ_002308 [Myxococcota bacterium]|jgi:hypothetical protein
MLTLILLLGTSGAATPTVGLEWRPLSRGDLMWTGEQRTSGLSVGEFDGFVRPALGFYAGAWTGPRTALLGSLGIARLQNTTVVNDQYRQRHWGVIRPALDARFAFADVVERKPIPWILAGLYGDIPSARDVSNGYTDDEQETADELAGAERARLGGAGLRAGFGVDWRFAGGIVIGGQYAVGVHRAVFQADDTDSVTAWTVAEASLLVGFEWPGREREVTEPEPPPEPVEPLPPAESGGVPDSADAEADAAIQRR